MPPIRLQGRRQMLHNNALDACMVPEDLPVDPWTRYGGRLLCMEDEIIPIGSGFSITKRWAQFGTSLNRPHPCQSVRLNLDSSFRPTDPTDPNAFNKT